VGPRAQSGNRALCEIVVLGVNPGWAAGGQKTRSWQRQRLLLSASTPSPIGLVILSGDSQKALRNSVNIVLELLDGVLDPIADGRSAPKPVIYDLTDSEVSS